MKTVQQVLNEYTNLFIQLYKEQAPVASGELRNSLSGIIVINGDHYDVIINISEIWKYIEYGRKPDKYPPVQAMRDYIRNKKIIPQPFTLPSGRKVIPTNDQLAFLFGRKIYRDGIEPNPIFQESIDALNEWLVEELTPILIDNVYNEFVSIFKTINDR
jgi:hypothetical protein